MARRSRRLEEADALMTSDRISELEAEIVELKFQRRDAVMSVVEDLRKQIQRNTNLTEADVVKLSSELDYYTERVETWSEPRPKVLELQEALNELRTVTCQSCMHLLERNKELADKLIEVSNGVTELYQQVVNERDHAVAQQERAAITWHRYHNHLLSREEFEGTIAELAEKRSD